MSGIEGMPIPENVVINNGMNNLIVEEMSFDVDEMLEQHNRLYPCLTDEQRDIYHTIMWMLLILVMVEFSSYMVMVARGKLTFGIHYALRNVVDVTLFYQLHQVVSPLFFFQVVAQPILDLVFHCMSMGLPCVVELHLEMNLRVC